MRKRIFVLLVTVLLLGGNSLVAQDAHFSQFYANPLYLNPAFAGTNVCPRFSLNFRDQWPDMPGTFLSYSASYDQHFDKLAGGIGVLLFGDRAGDGGSINTYSASFIYSFKVKVSRKFNMRFSLQATYQQKTLNWNNLTWGDMIDPKYGFIYATNEPDPGKTSRGIFDLSAGFLGYTKNFYFGVAAHHITNPYEGFLVAPNSDSPEARLPVKWTAHVGGNFDLKRKSKKERSFGDIS
ncbi:MAG: PorP/SprF family type IX secretion system membrane protein, partial [Bacteroidales bacterium]